MNTPNRSARSSELKAQSPLDAMAEPLSPGSSDLDSVASLPSSSASSETLTETEGERTRREEDAEREWKESLQQLELLLTMVVVPYVGKYFGRKAAYWGAFEVPRRSFRLTGILHRVGQIHALAIPRRHFDDKLLDLQSYRCC